MIGMDALANVSSQYWKIRPMLTDTGERELVRVVVNRNASKNNLNLVSGLVVGEPLVAGSEDRMRPIKGGADGASQRVDAKLTQCSTGGWFL